MGITEYLFAFFIFILVIAAMFIYSRFFTGITTQKKLLDERETKLLRLFQNVEDMLEEFNDTMEMSQKELDIRFESLDRRQAELIEAMNDISGMINNISKDSVMPMMENIINYKEPEELEKSRSDEKTAKPAGGFKSLLDTVNRVEVTLPAPAESRKKSILDMSRDGKTRGQIAQELSITLSEVDLILGVAGKES